MDRPVMLHFVDKEQFTAAAWSLEQPSIVFFSSDKGNLEVWDITRRKSDPIQTQNIAGRAINGITKNCSKFGLGIRNLFVAAICPYRGVMSSEEEGHFISVADNSGTLRMMKLPKHLWNLEGAHGPKTIELAVSIYDFQKNWNFAKVELIFRLMTCNCILTTRLPRSRRRKG